MLTLYRGHWILTFCEQQWSSEITERATAEMLPTSVRATLTEGPGVCLARAKRLIDLYLGPASPPERRSLALRSQSGQAPAL